MDSQNPSSAPHGSHQHPQPPQQQPTYDLSKGGHYGASVHLSQQGFAPSELYTGTWANVHQGLTGSYKDILTAYWQQTINHLETDQHDYKQHQLPLARIKKVMKADPEVKMISAEAPILFAKGCDIFITELTMRAWIHAEENKRRTLQRSDIASALAKSDMFDFLIDIVPREEASSHAKRTSNQQAAAANQQPPQVPGVGPGPGGQHTMNPADYGVHQIGQEGDYRNPQTMYPGQVMPGAPSYGQPQAQMYNADEMYYGTIQQQQRSPQLKTEEQEEGVVGGQQHDLRDAKYAQLLAGPVHQAMPTEGQQWVGSGPSNNHQSQHSHPQQEHYSGVHGYQLNGGGSAGAGMEQGYRSPYSPVLRHPQYHEQQQQQTPAIKNEPSSSNPTTDNADPFIDSAGSC
ncbi:histone-fold-containing protein [Cercophora samala]|uniref:Histone-fold-containing protein n=1 Tax=Cercophora samala TaxID=330535 RepID=A0AA40D7J6_9PEZI|nr:histone-fold-containing protein [Cercophora samala]